MLSKKQQTSQKCRLKAKRVPEREPKYLAWLHEVEQPSCMVCGLVTGIQMHHVKENSTEPKIDSEIIPLCYNHHLGSQLSPHGTPKLFREMYPKKQQLEVAKALHIKYKGE